jgi:hypothetical protein
MKLFLVIFTATLLLSVHGHGRLNIPMTRGGPGYEDGPVGVNDARTINWVCRHEKPMQPAVTYQAGSNINIKYDHSAIHPGDCEIFLSYDYNQPRESMKWFKIANIPDCKKYSGKQHSIFLPKWLKKGTVTLRWSWYALHVRPNVNFLFNVLMLI